MQNICKEWKITHEEYLLLEEKYGQLVEFISWNLIKRNTRCNHTDEQIDIAQDLRIALLRAGSYTKRQNYIERCLALCSKHVKNSILKNNIAILQDLWNNKTRHGASRQKFGPDQELLLEKLVRKIVPPKERPNKNASLVIDSKFSTYCKSIMWNTQKALGKKISKEKPIRTGSVSLSEFDHMFGNLQEK